MEIDTLTIYLNNRPHIMDYTTPVINLSIQNTLPYILLTAVFACTLPFLRTWMRAVICAANVTKQSIACA